MIAEKKGRGPFCVSVVDLNDIGTECVDRLRIPPLADAFKVVLIVLMHMSVNEQFRMVFVDQPVEHIESGMRQIGVVAELIGGGMGQQNIEAAIPPELEAQFFDALAHLAFGVHVRPLAVAHAAAKAENAQTVVLVNRILDADAALGRILRVSAVVVAVDVEDGRSGKAGEEGEIVCRQIAAGEDQIDVLEPASVEMIPQAGICLIGEQKNLHDAHPLLPGAALCWERPAARRVTSRLRSAR